MATHTGHNDEEWSMSKPFDMKTTNGKVLVFAIFLLLSFIFWYLDALGNDLEADIRYPVRYTNIPEVISPDDVTQRVNLYLEGKGYSMLKLKFTSKPHPIVIDFKKIFYRQTSENSQYDYYIVTSRLVQEVTQQLKPTCKISNIKPDTLYFKAVAE